MSIALCRTCLTGKVNVYVIRSTPLEEIYEDLTNYELYSKDGRPGTVCYLCHALLEKWRRLKTKSRKSEEILTQLFQKGIQITPETVNIISKHMQLNFITTPVELITWSKVDAHRRPPTINGSVDSKATVKLETKADEGSIIEYTNKEQQLNILQDKTICRSCLGPVSTTHSIVDTPLQVIFEKLTNAKLFIGVGRPTSVCYICVALLKKCRRFIIKAKKCNNILTELFRNEIQLTEYTVAVLNSRIKPGLTVTPIKLITYTDLTDAKVKEEIIESNRDDDDDDVVEAGASPQLGQIVTNEHTKTLVHKSPNAKIWDCSECGYSSNIEIQLQKHKRFHDPRRKFACKICRYRYKTSKLLETHKRNVHQFIRKCDKCPQTFTDARTFKMHRLRHTNTYLTCEICGDVFNRRAGLTSHSKKNHPNALHPCGKCNAVFPTSQFLREHVLNVHTRYMIYICDLCGHTFKDKSVMRKHMLFVHLKLEKLECDVCGKKLPSKNTMIAHLASHRLIKPYKCNLCSRLFNTSSSLSSHKRNHRRFQCKMCDSAYKFRIDLLAHVKLHTELACDICHEFTVDLEKHKLKHTGGVLAKCHYCDKTMGKDYLYRHLRIHTGEKPYQCDVCQKRFPISTHLKNHMATHTGVKNIACDICDMTFIQSGQLKRHLQTHAGIKPFLCTHCGRKFTEKRTLRYHISIAHTKNKNKYICDMCYKVHTNKEQLTQHIISHKGKKNPFSCSVCRKAFKTLILMCHHIKTHKIKQWPCTMCDYKFGKSGLNRHYQIKHGVHAYACNICEEGTNDVSMLLSHMTSHGAVTYRCQTCGKTLAYGRGLLKHMRNVHKLEVKKPYTQYYSIDRI